jgi:hypothetical protein
VLMYACYQFKTMGVTTHSDKLVQKHKGSSTTMLELGSQNTYFDCEPMGVAKDYYTNQGFEHHSIDANGEYGSLAKDLSQLHDLGTYDLVTDFGTSEHVPDFYMCWLNKHNACKVGGLIISENPKVDNWHGHGYHYLTKEFYIELAKATGYELVEVGEHPAMGNVTDGWNVYGVLRKVNDNFISRGKFNELPFTSTLAPDGTEFIPFEGSEAEAKVIAYKERFPADDEQVEQPKPETVQPKKKRGRPSKK